MFQATIVEVTNVFATKTRHNTSNIKPKWFTTTLNNLRAKKIQSEWRRNHSNKQARFCEDQLKFECYAAAKKTSVNNRKFTNYTGDTWRTYNLLNDIKVRTTKYLTLPAVIMRS